MSRLVLDNGYSTEYAVRVFDHANGEQQIFPARVIGSSYRVRKTRDWMTDDTFKTCKPCSPISGRTRTTFPIESRTRYGWPSTSCQSAGWT